MPADKFTKKADTPKKKRQWDHVYKSAKAHGASAGSAIRQANAAVGGSTVANNKRKGDRKYGQAKARRTPYDPQGTKPAGRTGTTKPKKSMKRKKVSRASRRRSR